MDADLVEATDKRPLSVRATKSDFGLSLRDYCRRNPNNTALLAGATLPVLAVLAAYPGPHGALVQHVKHEAAVHANTARASLRRLRDRGLISNPEPGRYALADHATTERQLGNAFAKYRLGQRTPRGVRRAIDISPLVRIVEADKILDLPLTAASRFQAAGAAVVAHSPQMRVHAFRDDKEISLETALEDARNMKTAPRTLRSMEAFLYG